MRFRTANIFLPFRKKSQRRGRIGSVWQFLERIGPVTRSSPARRAIQVICLLVFLDAFFRVCWPYSKHFTATTFSNKETLPVELFLLIDPLVGLSTALAARALNFATLWWMLGILVYCVLIPRAFCGYLCPLGTMIDAFDWLIGRHFRRWHVLDNPTDPAKSRWWVHFKYYLLITVLMTSACGVLSSSFVSAIPVLTRGLLFSLGRVQLGIMKGENMLAPVGPMFYLSLGLFVVVFLLSLKGRRFWCRYVCPSGALLSVFNFLRVGERKVESTCINCNKCVEICPFDAIEEDFTTRDNDCTFCQTCGGVCPTQAIKFVTRWNETALKVEDDPPVQPRPISRRAFVVASVLGATAAVATRTTLAYSSETARPIRPPGSVPEPQFLDLCIRCGECFKVCPGPVLHPAGLEYGLEALWTPVATPEHAGCHQDCTFCTQVCPTGAIQPLDLLVKQRTHMGLAAVDTQTCLPFDHENREDCDLCYVECKQAGYHAIEMRPIELPVNRDELEAMGFSDSEIDEMSTILTPFVNADQCTGCGICTYRCHTRYVVQDDRLQQAAITITAENEHRRMTFPNDSSGLGSADT
ncbi:MAG TPA: 4Fe-4S binding protein [Pirellulaceae bacterium]|nr:4Fe-4S binding protein [Pirellulaceae bacterium]